MAGLAQRHGVGETAGDGDVVLRRPLGEFRQPCARTGQARTFGGVGDFELRIACNRPQTASDGAPERLAVAGLAVCGAGVIADLGHVGLLGCYPVPAQGRWNWRSVIAARVRPFESRRTHVTYGFDFALPVAHATRQGRNRREPTAALIVAQRT